MERLSCTALHAIIGWRISEEKDGRFRPWRKMKKRWKKAAATLAGLLVALVALDLFCYGYYNPAGYEWDEYRATDTIREPGAFTARAREGFAWATIDDNGYNNAQVPGEDGVFVLMMGSSHTEGLYVKPGEDVSSQLHARLMERGLEGCVYNIGISAHTLMRNAANLERALSRFEPTGYVVLETQEVKFGKSSVEKALNDSFERQPWTESVISDFISRRPLLRTLYRQWEVLMNGGDEEEAQAEVTAEQLAQYEAALTQLMEKLRAEADDHGVELIVYYHPHLYLQEDGSALPQTDAGCLDAFSSACAAAGVEFLDMTDAFLAAYAQGHILPHGFSNTAPGVGHLNPQGNALIADALCAKILEKEAAK